MSTDLTTGQDIEGLPARFELKEELGRGGMAYVHHAYDTVGKRDVALKFLPQSDDEDLRKRFQREAVDLAGVFHPNVVDFYSLGECGSQEFIEMEYVSGGTLSQFQRECDSLAKSLEVYAQICEGIDHIHSAGLVHRDIKPANILMTEDGIPKISDLGLARREEGRTQLTQAGTILGTASYLAPEQLLSHQVGPEADIYALGVCLFEAICGRPPFFASTPLAMVRAHVEDQPPTPSELMPGLPEELDRIVLQMMEKKAPNRPKNLRQLAEQLRSVASQLTPVQDALVASSPEALLGRARLHLQSGNAGEAVRILESFDNVEGPLRVAVLCERARALVLTKKPEALEMAKEIVEETRSQNDLEGLGKALVVYGQAATQAKDWDLALEALQEARGLVPSNNHDLQVQLMDSLVSLHNEGSQAGHPSLSSEESQKFQRIRDGLSRRLDSSSIQAPQSTAPAQAVASPQRKSKPQPKGSPQTGSSEPPKKPAWLLPVAVLLPLILVGYLTHMFLNRKARLEIDSDPPAATVLVNTKRFVAPYKGQVEAGDYKIKVHLKGHFPKEETISLKAGETFKLTATLKPSSGGVTITSKPEGAKVFFNGQPRGKTPVKLASLPLEKFKVKCVKEGYKAHEQVVEVVGGKTQNIEVALTRIPPPQPVYRPTYRPSSSYSSGRRSYSRPRKKKRGIRLPKIRIKKPWK